MTELPPELEASFKQMEADLAIANSFVRAARAAIWGYELASRLAGFDSPKGVLTKAHLERGQQSVEGLIQRHRSHMQALFPDAKRGAKVKAGASEAADSTNQKIREKRALQWKEWEDIAKAKWEEQPDTSIREMARYVMHKTDAREKEFHAIRKHIAPFWPKRQETG